MKKIVIFSKTVLFIGVLWILSVIVTVLCRPKWYREGIWEPVTEIHDGFYALEKDSLDVAFVGSSQIFSNINPLLIWKEYGISSYDMTSSAQRAWISKYYIQEILKYQSPKVIVLDMMKFYDATPNDEDRNRKALDYMRMSKEKMEAIRESIRGCPDETMISYIFPIIRYHKRWADLTSDDFGYFFKTKGFYMHGYDPRYGVEEQPLDRFLPHENQEERLPERNRKIMENIIAVCKEKNVDLVLIRTPQKDWTWEQHCEIEVLAQTFDLTFIDYNLLLDEIKLESRDYNDINHLNANGADKVSAHIGRYLKENYSFDRHNNSKSWDMDYKKYLEYDGKRCRDERFLHEIEE